MSLVLPSVQAREGNSHMTDTVMMLLCVCKQAVIKLISDALYTVTVSLALSLSLSLSLSLTHTHNSQ